MQNCMCRFAAKQFRRRHDSGKRRACDLKKRRKGMGSVALSKIVEQLDSEKCDAGSGYRQDPHHIAGDQPAGSAADRIF